MLFSKPQVTRLIARIKNASNSFGILGSFGLMLDIDRMDAEQRAQVLAAVQARILDKGMRVDQPIIDGLKATPAVVEYTGADALKRIYG